MTEIGPKIAQLGCTTMSTPTKPIATAIHRRHPTCSFSMTAERMVRMNGSMKKIATASATGMTRMAAKKSVLLVATSAPRKTFIQSRFGMRPRAPWK